MTDPARPERAERSDAEIGYRPAERRREIGLTPGELLAVTLRWGADQLQAGVRSERAGGRKPSADLGGSPDPESRPGK